VSTAKDPQPGPLAGRRAIITGAGSGIGEACARSLAAQGASVAVLDVRADAVERVVAELRADGARAVGALCDVGSEDSVASAVASASGTFGGLDAVVASAGITRSGETDGLSLEEWETVIRVNLTGAFLTLKHTLGALVAAGGGTVVTIGSVASLVAAGRASSYDASKGGVLQLTRAIAAEYADRNIRANCVCPGVVGTALAQNSQILYGSFDPGAGPATGRRTRAPMSRKADPGEIAAVVAFLCSDASSFMTGAAVPVDGGFTAV
jgi:NAD(P)-dependent dehydrogenase (short-subunit alcohol dehydrogenase family)